jgi:thiol-disulfide isomerase/thioredoxin
MTIIKFYSPNCDACLKMQPVLDLIQKSYQQNNINIEFQSYDTLDIQNQAILEKYKIIKKQTLLPALIFLDDEELEVGRLTGKNTEKEIVTKIDETLKLGGEKSPSSTFNLSPSDDMGFDSRKEIADYVAKVNQIKKDNPLDLSSDEDLSIAIMNLISIEEHLFFTANKTQNVQYYSILKEVREVRKRALKMIIKEYEGEVWCISKHLLATSMRLMEVGTKQLGQGKNEQAQSLFADSYRMYLLFWGLNMGLIDSSQTLENNPTKDQLSQTFQDSVDCCNE